HRDESKEASNGGTATGGSATLREDHGAVTSQGDGLALRCNGRAVKRAVRTRHAVLAKGGDLGPSGARHKQRNLSRIGRGTAVLNPRSGGLHDAHLVAVTVLCAHKRVVGSLLDALRNHIGKHQAESDDREERCGWHDTTVRPPRAPAA